MTHLFEVTLTGTEESDGVSFGGGKGQGCDGRVAEGKSCLSRDRDHATDLQTHLAEVEDVTRRLHKRKKNRLVKKREIAPQYIR